MKYVCCFIVQIAVSADILENRDPTPVQRTCLLMLLFCRPLPEDQNGSRDEREEYGGCRVPAQVHPAGLDRLVEKIAQGRAQGRVRMNAAQNSRVRDTLVQ